MQLETEGQIATYRCYRSLSSVVAAVSAASCRSARGQTVNYNQVTCFSFPSMPTMIFSREILFILSILSIHVRIPSLYSRLGFNIDGQDRQDELRRNLMTEEIRGQIVS